MCRTLWEAHSLVTVVERPRENDDPLPAHDPQLPGPEPVPLRVLFCPGEPRVEAGLDELPAFGASDGSRERADVVIGVRVAEHIPNSVEQVLSVNEHDGALEGRFRGQSRPLKK